LLRGGIEELVADKGYLSGAVRRRQPARAGDKVGRSDTCPCGRGKKYKKRHGAEK
jgi:uncharacterized protein YecA (UPF0149 family)